MSFACAILLVAGDGASSAAAGMLLSYLSEQSQLSLLSIRWRSGGRSVKAELTKGKYRDPGLVSTVNALVEL